MENYLFIDDISQFLEEFLSKEKEENLLDVNFITQDYNWFKLGIKDSNLDRVRLEKFISKRIGQTKVFYVDLNGNLYNNAYNLLCCKELDIPVSFKFQL